MKIIKYEECYFDECVDLFIKVFNSAPWNDKWTAGKAAARLDNFVKSPSFIGYISLVESKVRAVCFGNRNIWWNGDEYFIEEMYIDNEIQRTGSGSDMLNFIINDLANLQIEAVTLLTGRKLYAKDFYKKNGFDVSENIVYMIKDL